MSPWGTVAITVSLVTLLAATGPAESAGATTPLQPISSDPYVNPYSQHMTEVEPHVLAEGSTIVAAFQVGRFRDAGASDIGWSTSTDDGATWTPGYLPGITEFEGAGSYASVSDPTVGFDQKHGVWLITSLGIYAGSAPGEFAPEGDVVVSRSVDGGSTWQDPLMIAGNGTLYLDKPWVVCDNTPSSPYHGNCYVTFDDYGKKNLVSMSTSADGGITWSAPTTTVNLQQGVGGAPVVQPDGTVVVPLLGRRAILAFSSSDGGDTWGETSVIARVEFANGWHSPPQSVRATPFPASAVASNGHIYVAWSDCHFSRDCRRNDTVLSSSKDGSNWSRVRRIPLDAPASKETFIGPSIAIDPASSGPSVAIALTSYSMPQPSCRPAECRIGIDYASSTDGGKHWTRAQPLAEPMNLKWAPETSQGYMFGDYFGLTVSSDGLAIPALSIAGPATVALDQAIYSGRLAIVAGTIPIKAPATAARTDQWSGATAALPTRTR